MTLEIDSLAQEIRRVDGNHTLGAGALAEALMPFIKRSMQGSAEPVAYMDPNEGFVKDAFIWEADPCCAPRHTVPVYAAPPAPVSAETVNTETLINGLRRGIQAAKLALFVIRKRGVMPNSSWESGFNSDVAAAQDALDSAIASAPPSTDAKDSERLDWLQENFHSRQLDDFERRIQKLDCWSWMFYAPKDVQGDIRKVIDAAIAAKEKAQ